MGPERHPWTELPEQPGPQPVGSRPDEAEYYYPNNQSARLLWYHDHAFGITRINAYAGIASAYIIRDDFERSMIVNPTSLPPIPTTAPPDPTGIPDYIENRVLAG